MGGAEQKQEHGNCLLKDQDSSRSRGSWGGKEKDQANRGERVGASRGEGVGASRGEGVGASRGEGVAAGQQRDRPAEGKEEQLAIRGAAASFLLACRRRRTAAGAGGLATAGGER